MPAPPPAQESEAFARLVLRPADAHVHEVANAQLVDGKTAAADLAGDLPADVKGRAPLGHNTEDEHAPVVGRSDEGDRADRGFGHPRIIPAKGPTGKACLRDGLAVGYPG